MAVRLEASRARLQTVLNSLDEAIVVVDEAGRTILTNSRYDELFEAPLETIDMLQADGKPLPDGELPHQQGAHGQSFRRTVAVTDPDGVRRMYEITGRPIHGDGEGGGGVLLIRRLEGAESAGDRG
jgi:PAS domain-containing protein